MSEFDHQVALFQWARIGSVQAAHPGLDLLEGSMNGVRLTVAQAGKAKAAGMLKGAHDVCLPVARGQYIGLSIEMKYGKNRPTADQIWYAERLRDEGWRVEFCWDWTDARDIIVEYLSQPALSRAVAGSISTPNVSGDSQCEC